MTHSNARDRYFVIFLGAPGSGKGTQSLLVAEKFELTRIETSKLLEATFRNAKEGETIKMGSETFEIFEQKRRWSTGLLCEDGFVAYIVAKKVEDLYSTGKNIVLDGFPRTIGQMDPLLPALQEKFGEGGLIVVYLDIAEEETIKRNGSRRICDLMRHPILSNEETARLKHCPLDGSLLKQRELDDPEVIKVRFQTFQKETLPLIEYFKEKNIAVHSIHGDQPAVDVFQEVSGIIKEQTNA